MLGQMATKKKKIPLAKRDTEHFDPAINPKFSNIPAEAEQPSGGERVGHALWEIGKTIGFIVVAAIIIRAFLIQPFFVQGESMEPDFHDGDYLLVNQLSYHLHQPHRGDVIVFKAPPEPDTNYIKRIIGVPGDTVDLKDGHYIITNAKHPGGEIVTEPYIEENTPTDPIGDQTHWEVPKDQYFTSGDNRQPGKSLDSRAWGFVPKNFIKGSVWIRAYPLANAGFIKHAKYPNLSAIPSVISLAIDAAARRVG
jgi:signal peptidase I